MAPGAQEHATMPGAMKVPAIPQDPIDFLQWVLRSFEFPTNSAVSLLAQAAEHKDLPVIGAVRQNLADLLGLSFVAAQAVLNRGKAQRPLKNAPTKLHAWLTDVELINAIANFWKHHGEWSGDDWTTVEGAMLSRADLKGKVVTPVQLAGLGVARVNGSENMFILAKAAGISEESWNWLVDPLRAWW
jgi:hypothetical protein